MIQRLLERQTPAHNAVVTGGKASTCQSATPPPAPQNQKISNISTPDPTKYVKQVTNHLLCPLPDLCTISALSLIKLAALPHKAVELQREIQSTKSFSKQNQDLLSLPASSLTLWHSVVFFVKGETIIHLNI